MPSMFGDTQMPSGQSDIGGGSPKNQYKFLQWIEPQDHLSGFAKTGGFFMPQEQFPDGLELEEKHLTEVKFSGGEAKLGLGFPLVYAAPLAFRMDWMVKRADGSRKFADSYNAAQDLVQDRDDRVQGRTRFVVLMSNIATICRKIEGESIVIPDHFYGPFMFTIYGKRGKCLQDAFAESDKRLLKPASKIEKMDLPVYTFWVPLKVASEPQRASNDPKIRTMIWPPVLAWAKDARFSVEDAGKRLFVGPDMIQYASSLWDEVQEWATAPIVGVYGEPDTSVARAQQEEEEPRGRQEPPPFRRERSYGAGSRGAATQKSRWSSSDESADGDW